MTVPAAVVPMPVRPWRPLVPVSTMILAGALMVAAGAGTPLLTVVSAVVMLCLVVGWVALVDPPSYRGTTVVLLVGAVAVLIGGSLFAQDGLLWLAASVGLVTLLAFIHQLTRRGGRPRLVESISASITGIVLLASGASLLPVASTVVGRESATAVMAAVLVGSLADAGIRFDWTLLVSAAVAVVLGAGAAVLVSVVLGMTLLHPLAAAVVGALAGGSSHAVRQVQSVLPRLSLRRAQISGAAASVLAVGLFTHVATWLAGALG